MFSPRVDCLAILLSKAGPPILRKTRESCKGSGSRGQSGAKDVVLGRWPGVKEHTVSELEGICGQSKQWVWDPGGGGRGRVCIRRWNSYKRTRQQRAWGCPQGIYKSGIWATKLRTSE